jgi:hypothetical protein
VCANAFSPWEIFVRGCFFACRTVGFFRATLYLDLPEGDQAKFLLQSTLATLSGRFEEETKVVSDSTKAHAKALADGEQRRAELLAQRLKAEQDMAKDGERARRAEFLVKLPRWPMTLPAFGGKCLAAVAYTKFRWPTS